MRRIIEATVAVALLALAAGTAAAQCQGDANQNGFVNFADYGAVVKNFGQSCSPETRFVDNGDGTISDNGTGLTWAKKSDDGSIHDKDNNYTWGSNSAPYPPNGTAFTDYIARLNGSADGSCFAGHCDWRLPTIEELQGLVVPSEAAPKIDPIFKSPCTPGCTVTACSCTQSSYYWSATTLQLSPGNAWFVGFTDGVVTNAGKTSNPYVRAVRSGS